MITPLHICTHMIMIRDSNSILTQPDPKRFQHGPIIRTTENPLTIKVKAIM